MIITPFLLESVSDSVSRLAAVAASTGVRRARGGEGLTPGRSRRVGPAVLALGDRRPRAAAGMRGNLGGRAR